jgi:vacuolar-type H+-ATPase subunit I/STV1
MNNILIYAILGVAIGILVYMFSCEIKKSMLTATYKRYIDSNTPQYSSNEVIDDDDANPSAVLQELNLKTTSCTDALEELTGAITKLREEHTKKKEQIKGRLKACNVTFEKFVKLSKKYRNGEDDETFLKRLRINRNKFKE